MEEKNITTSRPIMVKKNKEFCSKNGNENDTNDNEKKITKRRKTINDFLVTNNSEYNYVSYGTKKGKFFINNFRDIETKLIYTDIFEDYALCEKKSAYYKLVWDFDFKTGKEYSNLYKGKENEIAKVVVDTIIVTIKQFFKEPNVDYIYCVKKEKVEDENGDIKFISGNGVHLYFPNIVVCGEVNMKIRKMVIDLLLRKKEFNFDIKLWNAIIDDCIAKENGLRLPYFYANNNFYHLSKKMSTHKVPKETIDRIILCSLNTTETKCNYEIKIDLNMIIVDKLKKEKQKFQVKTITEKIQKNNKNIILQVLPTQNRQLLIDLLQTLSVEHMTNRTSWLNTMFLCRSYGLYDVAIEISKKSTSFNDDSLKTINDIFKKEELSLDSLEEDALKNWVKYSNYTKYIEIMNKHNAIPELVINHSDDILLHGSDVKYDFEEETQYVSDKALDVMQNAIENKDIKVICIHAPTGSGKTTKAVDLIDYFKKTVLDGHTMKMLSIVTRRNIAGHHSKLFKGMTSYLESDETNKHAISFEQVYKMTNRYHTLFLDEISTLIDHISSPTMNSTRRKSVQKLLELIFEAELIIMLDSNITTSVHELLKIGKIIDPSSVFHYRNRYKNRNGIPMTIHQSTHKCEMSKIAYACNTIKDDIIKRESKLIFTDSKKVSYEVLMILESFINGRNYIEMLKIAEEEHKKNGNDIEDADLYQNIKKEIDDVEEKIKRGEQGYFIIFNSDCGTIEDMKRINELAPGHCIICTPKIGPGIDITFKYLSNIVCIYRGNTNPNYMDALQYHQQYSRTRNAIGYDIYDLSPFSQNTKNSYITYESNRKYQINLINEKYSTHKKLAQNQKSENTVDGIAIIGNKKINMGDAFMEINMFQSWMKRITQHNKMQLFTKLAEECGYVITYKNMNVIDINFDTRAIKEYYTNNIKNIRQKILDNCKDMTDDTLNMYETQLEKVDNHLKFLNASIETITDEAQKIVIDDKKFENYVSGIYLRLDKNTYNQKKINANNNNLKEFIGKEDIFKKIDAMEWVENLVGVVNRCDVNSINKNEQEIQEIIKKIVDNIKAMYIFDSSRGMKEFIKRETEFLKKRVTTNDQLQMYVAEKYNKISEGIIKYEKKVKQYQNNGESTRRTIYSNFVIKESTTINKKMCMFDEK